ncbi:MAG: tetratricopeptide (TPR) repeat protein, partial [Cryomorphaceae bacterium]
MINVDLQQQEESEKLLHQAKLQLQQGQLTQAQGSLATLLADHPKHRDGLYYLAVCQRKGGDTHSAMMTLEQLKLAHPGYGRAWQEEGHNYRALRQDQNAAQAFTQAVSLNPALLASWQALLKFYENAGQEENAKEAMTYVSWLSSLPAQLQTVASLIHENKLFMAEKICRHFLQTQPQHVEAMRLLAEIGNQLQILDDAEFLLESCVEFYPDYPRARMDYVHVLHKRQKFEKSLAQAILLHEQAPENIGYEITLANEYQAAGNFPKALAIYDRVLTQKPNLHTVHSAKGHALKTIARTDDAVNAYRAAYKSKPDFGDAYWSLANLKTYEFSDGELKQMRAQEQATTSASIDRIHLCFALGKAMEDRGQFAESFAWYDKGNTLKQADSGYRAERTEADLEKQKSLFDRDFFSQRSGMGCSSAAPIFIVGLPRAGSTLLEQILASHSQVDGTMELSNIIGLANRLNGRRSAEKDAAYPRILAELKTEQFERFGEDFIKDTAFHRCGGNFFVDKMPNNFRHIPLIHLILPNAKIIDARRHPMACCFSGFKQLFAEGQ